MDPVRFLSNPSTGAMGLALALEMQKRGGQVVLVMGPTQIPVPRKIKVIPVTTALEMRRTVQSELKKADVFIGAAAVGDWRFEKVAGSKIKKGKARSMTVRLIKNPDILAEAARALKRSRRKTLVVGFALETSNRLKNAIHKLETKNLDLVVANGPESFSGARTKAVLIDRFKSHKEFLNVSKRKLAAGIAGWLDNQWKNHP